MVVCSKHAVHGFPFEHTSYSLRSPQPVFLRHFGRFALDTAKMAAASYHPDDLPTLSVYFTEREKEAPVLLSAPRLAPRTRQVRFLRMNLFYLTLPEGEGGEPWPGCQDWIWTVQSSPSPLCRCPAISPSSAPPLLDGRGPTLPRGYVHLRIPAPKPASWASVTLLRRFL